MIRFIAGKRRITSDDIERVRKTRYEVIATRESHGKIIYAHATCFAALVAQYRRTLPTTIHVLTEQGTTLNHIDELQQLFPMIEFEYRTYQFEEQNGCIVTVRCTKETPGYLMYRALTMVRFLSEDVRESMHFAKYTLQDGVVKEEDSRLEHLTLLDLLRNAYFFSYIISHMPIDYGISFADMINHSMYLREHKESKLNYLNVQERALCLYFVGQANYELLKEPVNLSDVTPWPKVRTYTAYIRSEDVVRRAAQLLDATLLGVR